MKTAASVHCPHYRICLALTAWVGWLCSSVAFGEITLTDVTKQTGIDFVHTDGSHGGYFVMETVCAGLALFDYDGDGWIDIYFLNGAPLRGAKDTMKPCNRLYRNRGDWTFTDVTGQAGVGDTGFGLGVTAGDIDNDGLLDFLMTSYQNQWSLLYQNIGDGMFQDVTLPVGAGADTLYKVTWGNSLVDFDLDGDLDLFIACGHLQDTVDSFDSSSTYLQHNVLLENTGQRRFRNISARGGSGMQVRLSSRGAGFDDLDNDGDVDVVVLNSRREPTIMRNDTPTRNHWLEIQLQGKKTNRDGIGAQVRVVTDERTQLREVHGGRGYQSFYGKRLYFGLGTHAEVDRIEVRWIGGGTDVHRNIEADQEIRLVEGEIDEGI